MLPLQTPRAVDECTPADELPFPFLSAELCVMILSKYFALLAATGTGSHVTANIAALRAVNKTWKNWVDNETSSRMCKNIMGRMLLSGVQRKNIMFQQLQRPHGEDVGLFPPTITTSTAASDTQIEFNVTNPFASGTTATITVPAGFFGPNPSADDMRPYTYEAAFSGNYFIGAYVADQPRVHPLSGTAYVAVAGSKVVVFVGGVKLGQLVADNVAVTRIRVVRPSMAVVQLYDRNRHTYHVCIITVTGLDVTVMECRGLAEMPDFVSPGGGFAICRDYYARVCPLIHEVTLNVRLVRFELNDTRTGIDCKMEHHDCKGAFLTRAVQFGSEFHTVDTKGICTIWRDNTAKTAPPPRSNAGPMRTLTHTASFKTAVGHGSPGFLAAPFRLVSGGSGVLVTSLDSNGCGKGQVTLYSLRAGRAYQLQQSRFNPDDCPLNYGRMAVRYESKDANVPLERTHRTDGSIVVASGEKLVNWLPY
jgi:hypothetical protein